MSSNRRRHINALPGLKLLMCFSAGALALMAGLGYVYCQNQLHRALDETGRLEKEFQHIRTMSEVVEVSISKLSSPQELKKKRENGFFELRDIGNDDIVRISVPAPGLKELRAVSNERNTP